MFLTASNILTNVFFIIHAGDCCKVTMQLIIKPISYSQIPLENVSIIFECMKTESDHCDSKELPSDKFRLTCEK